MEVEGGMKKLLFILLILFTLIGCGDVIEKPYVTDNGDTIGRAYLITDSRVGHLRRGMTASSLRKAYGEQYVKQLQTRRESSNDTIPKKVEFYVYDQSNKLLFIAETSGSEKNSDEIDLVKIKDPRFRTTENIGINSSIEQVKKAYDNLNVIQDEGTVAIYIPPVDGYIKINPRYVNGYNPEFIADIPIDSVSNKARPLSFTISWYSHEVGLFSGGFWKDLIRKAVTWMVTQLPVILIIIAVFIALLRGQEILIRRVRKIAINRATKDASVDTAEALKRIDTLSGIVHGVGKILLWTIFILIILSKVNINIGPILASAGIVGLAVGFGAQELVRDFISGFFILLEDQLRTGDYAIINGTTGLVEKIELRTITLRDLSGVVHIFQNGKIDTLSNMTKEWSAIVMLIGVAYKENIDYVMQVMTDVGKEMKADPEFGEYMLDIVEVLGLDEFADSSIVIKAMVKTKPMHQWRIKREYQLRLKKTFDEKGIEIPFPHLSLYTGEATKPMPINIHNMDNRPEEMKVKKEIDPESMKQGK